MAETAHPNSQAAEHEKKLVALSSVAAAVFLTSMKIVVGLLTGSLGILSEAAHSGLDLVAAAVTFFAVRISGKPADQVHTYGHGKVENLSALFETALLLLTCVWIIYEAIQRLFFKSVEVQASIWSFGVMGVSILVDITRSRALSRVAKKYESQALEADALHFSTDIWSSSVVIAGLILVALANTLNLPWLAQADAVAAIGVAIIVVYVSFQLGKKTISDLLDAIPPGLRENVIAAAAQTPGVKSVKQARVRRAGPEVFADLTLEVERDTVLENAQRISDRVEERVLQVIPRADVIVLIEPSPRGHEGYLANIRSLANQHGLSAHGIRVYDVQGEHSVEMHVEVKEDLLLSEAHQHVAAFEKALKDALPDISNVVTHIEPAGETSISREAVNTSEEQVREIIAQILDEKHLECTPQDIVVRIVRGEMNISLVCEMDPEMPITEAHTVTEILEQQIRERIPGIGRILVHLEPGHATAT